jgi:hypothetical protein
MAISRLNVSSDWKQLFYELLLQLALSETQSFDSVRTSPKLFKKAISLLAEVQAIHQMVVKISQSRIHGLSFIINRTINRRSYDLFPIGSLKSTFLSLFGPAVYKILDSMGLTK